MVLDTYSIANANAIPIHTLNIHIDAHNAYTANVLTIKTTGTGNCGVPAG